MPTLKRAAAVKAGMEKGTNRRYVIFRDILHHCFRVLPEGMYRIWCHKVEDEL
jgi:hypothetical protein